MIRRAFTLIELLIATALTLVVVAAATTALYQMQRVLQRLQARQDLHDAAALVHDRLYRAASSMHPCTAVWLHRDAATGEVELVFMRGKESPRDFPTLFTEKIGYTDCVWTRWSWSAGEEILRISEGRSARFFQVWNNPGNWNLASAYTMQYPSKDPSYSRFVSIPQPWREAGAGTAQAVLDRNRWGVSYWQPADVVGDDIGDHQDLLRNARPMLHNCRDLVIEIVDAAGAVLDETAIDGGLVDGSAAMSGRPAVLRLRFTLTDPRIEGTSFTYSFSCPAPAIHRY